MGDLGDRKNELSHIRICLDGQLLSHQDADKRKAKSYTYDIHGGLISKKIDSEEISYTYDNNGNQLTITDSTGITERTYDEENKVLTKTVPYIGTISYEYDILEENGHHSEISEDPKGNVTKKVFDKAGRLAEVIEGDDSTTFEYYANGSKKSVTYPNVSREDYTYYMAGTDTTREVCFMEYDVWNLICQAPNKRKY